MRSDFDLVIRNAHVVTATDDMGCDIGLMSGRIVSLGLGLARGAREIDAAGRVVAPGGVEAHCHLDQPMEAPARMADDFNTATRSAACGGTNTVIPFAAQAKGQSLRAAVEDYHRRAQGKAHMDDTFHLIVSDPTPEVLQVELPALIREGYTSFNICMTYDDLKLNDGEILDVLDVARAHGAMAMVDAEEAVEQIRWGRSLGLVDSYHGAKCVCSPPPRDKSNQQVIWNRGDFTIQNSALHHAVDDTPYEGMQLKAWPGLTLSRGEVVRDGKHFVDRAGQGQFLHCGWPTLLPRRKQAATPEGLAPCAS